MKRFLILLCVIGLFATLTACGAKSETTENNESGKTETADISDDALKEAITSNSAYELADLRVIKEDDGKYTFVGNASSAYPVDEFPAFAADFVKVCQAAADSESATINYINPTLTIEEGKWIGWSTESHNFYDQDGILAENVELADLEATVVSYSGNSDEASDSTSTDSISDKFGSDLDAFQGEWKQEKSDWHLIISEDNITALYYEEYGDDVDKENTKQYHFDYDEEGHLVVFSYNTPKYIYEIQNDGRLLSKQVSSTANLENYYVKVSDTTVLPNVIEKVPPRIGMTELEVYESTWGSPKHKNTTETKYGKHEQWVYDNGYIYFDDGIVTAIQKK